MSPEDLYRLLLLMPPLLLSLVVHEFAHARTALAFGDRTAQSQGRCTLNPLAHLDPIGTLVLVVTQFIGWARPVPVNPNNLHPQRLGDAAVSLAGPLSNLCLAILVGIALKIMYAMVGPPESSLVRGAYMVLGITMLANIGLFMFNLIPLFPLDGHHIVREALPTVDQRMDFMRWQVQYGMYVLAALIFLPAVLRIVLGREVFSPIRWLYGNVAGLILGIMDIGPVLQYLM
jgi:Zn-dependent protease